MLHCFEILSTLTASIQVGHYPNVQAVFQSLASGSVASVQQWVDYARRCLIPGLQYFLDMFSEELSGNLVAFKSARLFLPHKVVELKPNASTVDSLQAFTFLNEGSLLQNLKAELPSYLAKATDVDPTMDPLVWWRTHSTDLPHWSTAASDVFLLQPSSVAAQRVFSLLKASFGPQQDTTLNDYIQASLMLQYNKH